MLFLHKVIPRSKRHQVSIVCGSRDGHATRTAYVRVTQLVCQLLELVRLETIVVPQHVVMGGSAGALRQNITIKYLVSKSEKKILCCNYNSFKYFLYELINILHIPEIAFFKGNNFMENLTDCNLQHCIIKLGPDSPVYRHGCIGKSQTVWGGWFRHQRWFPLGCSHSVLSGPCGQHRRAWCGASSGQQWRWFPAGNQSLASYRPPSQLSVHGQAPVDDNSTINLMFNTTRRPKVLLSV